MHIWIWVIPRNEELLYRYSSPRVFDLLTIMGKIILTGHINHTIFQAFTTVGKSHMFLETSVFIKLNGWRSNSAPISVTEQLMHSLYSPWSFLLSTGCPNLDRHAMNTMVLVAFNSNIMQRNPNIFTQTDKMDVTSIALHFWSLAPTLICSLSRVDGGKKKKKKQTPHTNTRKLMAGLSLPRPSCCSTVPCTFTRNC